MKKMIKHVAEKKLQNMAKSMGIDGLGKDGAIGAAFCVVWCVMMVMFCWVAC